MMRFSIFLLITAVAAWDDVILSPPTDKTGDPAVLYFAQGECLPQNFPPPLYQLTPRSLPFKGADIRTDQYTSILTDLQEKVDFPLWVGIPQCPANVAAIPFGLSSGIDRVGKAMVEQVSRVGRN